MLQLSNVPLYISFCIEVMLAVGLCLKVYMYWIQCFADVWTNMRCTDLHVIAVVWGLFEILLFHAIYRTTVVQIPCVVPLKVAKSRHWGPRRTPTSRHLSAAKTPYLWSLEEKRTSLLPSERFSQLPITSARSGPDETTKFTPQWMVPRLSMDRSPSPTYPDKRPSMWKCHTESLALSLGLKGLQWREFSSRQTHTSSRQAATTSPFLSLPECLKMLREPERKLKPTLPYAQEASLILVPMRMILLLTAEILACLTTVMTWPCSSPHHPLQRHLSLLSPIFSTLW